MAALAVLRLYMFYLGSRTVKARQWPLPGTWVFRRTAIQRGRRVLWRGVAMLGMSMSVIAGAAASWYRPTQYVVKKLHGRCGDEMEISIQG